MESTIEYIRCPNCRMVGVASLTHPDLCTECADYMNAMDRARNCECQDVRQPVDMVAWCIVAAIVGLIIFAIFKGVLQ